MASASTWFWIKVSDSGNISRWKTMTGFIDFSLVTSTDCYIEVLDARQTLHLFELK